MGQVLQLVAGRCTLNSSRDVLKVVHQLKKVRASLSFFTQHVLSQFIIDATIFITCTITGPDFAAHSVIYCDAHE